MSGGAGYRRAFKSEFAAARWIRRKRRRSDVLTTSSP
jgi:hypothetical protein